MVSLGVVSTVEPRSYYADYVYCALRKTDSFHFGPSNKCEGKL